MHPSVPPLGPVVALAALGALVAAGCGGDTGPTEPPVAPGVAETPAPVPACQMAPRLPTFHRLNRTEYQNTVNALLGIQQALRAGLPPDALLYGFDNNADGPVSAPLVQRYLNLAQTAVAAALESPASRAGLIPCALDNPGCRRQVLQRFLLRAFRRPATDAEIDEHLRYFELCDDSPRAGLACALEAALVSPSFLFRTELPEAAPTCAAEATLTGGAGGQLSPYALAARLSYFLWSSGPDQELLELAASGRLAEDAVIQAQVNRMLAPAAQRRFLRAFAEGLPTQWLQLDGVASAEPSSAVYPGFDEELRQAMLAESRLFFEEILQQNRSALELVRAPFTFVNQRLARHYGLPAVAGQLGVAMRRVDTTGTLRGGVLGQASFHTITSSSENTSMVLRGRWVLQNLLCTSLGDPPPGAQEMVPPPDPALGLSRRQSLERRTSIYPCSSCHDILNPVGFGLEIFDGIGAQRSSDRGQPIDTSGALPSGEKFQDTEQLLELLKADPRFPVCLTRKLLTYAVGHGLTNRCEEQAVEALAQAFRADGFHLKNHLVRIARSELFRTARRQPEEPAP
jgi:hypothetical protein